VDGSRTPGRDTIRRLALARAISGSGTTAAYVALTYAIYHETHSAAWVSVSIMATFTVAGIAAPVSGWIGDRYDRRRVMIASDLSAAALSVAVAAGSGTPWLMVALTLLVSLAEAPFFPASSAAVPNLVDDADLPWANGLLASSRSAGVLAGPIVGGVTVGTLGASGAFLCNAASFLASAALVTSAAGRYAAAREPHHQLPATRGLSAGYRFLVHDPVARLVSPAMGLLFLGMGLGMTADAPLISRLHAGPLSYAALVVAWGAGEIAGGLLFPRLARRLHTTLSEVRALGLALLGVAVGMGGIVAWPHLWFVLVVTVAGGLFAAPTFALRQGLLQRRTPDAMRSRVIAAVDTLTDGGQILGLAAAGVVIGVGGPLAAYGSSGLAIAGAGLVVLAVSSTAGFASASEESPLPDPLPVGSARFPHVAAEQADPL
jgi:MFS family permease